ncbi:MAG TPA: radical SAM protein [Candidatus Aquilonibacter sp.]|jgi:MoaA/NifB/PqqE/SkfB family radical SAM enzyme|nr:radical SAM protein [Candidatus Aquilonibacter sp.]
MSALTSIATPGATASDSAALAMHQINELPVLVIFPHNQCNCRCVMCDIWRIREAKEITPEDIEEQLSSLKKLGVRWVVLSGGEPQLNEKWSWLAQMLRSAGTRVTLLTAGLLLESQAGLVAEYVDDVIVSLDGPPAIHNKIRRVAGAFEQISEGIRALRRFRPSMEIRARCTVQKANHLSLRDVVESAKEIGLNSISFLAADLTSSAFNRPDGWLADRTGRVALDSQEIDALEVELERLIEDHRANFDCGFVVESPKKLRRIVQHFRAHLGLAENIAPRCNAPWVSAVIEATGDVRPCFFHPAFGNIHQQSLPDILNGPQALQFRNNLDVERNEICRSCVCSLYLARDSSKE